jgi:hypothetical protein
MTDLWIAGRFPMSFERITQTGQINHMTTVEEFDLDAAAAYDQWKAQQEEEWHGVHEQIEAEWAAGAVPAKPTYELLPCVYRKPKP